LRTPLLRTLTLLTLASACAGSRQAVVEAAPPASVSPDEAPKTEVMLVGFMHLSQLYREGVPESDVLSARRQEELAQLVTQLERFQPDLILVETEASEQATLDETYARFGGGQLAQSQLGRSETYQVAFALAKRRGLPGVYGVDHHESIPQGMLDQGENVQRYRDGLGQLQRMVREKNEQLLSGRLSLRDYIAFINRPDTIDLTHHLLFNLPAHVVNGTFSKPAPGVDMARIDSRYIGAEFISLFYNRNLKIYSNILTTHGRRGGKRILVTMGQVHVGVLQGLLEKNPDYRVVPADRYLGAR